MTTPRRAPRCSPALAALLLGLAAPARADWTDAFPRPLTFGLFLDLSATSEEDELAGGPRPFRFKDVYLRERLSLESSGYWYHPRFLQYELSAGVSVKQEEYESTDVASQGYVSDSGWDGNLKLSLLPEHPYNFLAFATRFEPVTKEQFAVHRDSVESTYGAIFRYRQKPFFFQASYVDDVIESGEASSEVRKLAANGEYFKQIADDKELSVDASAARSLFDGGDGLQGTLSEYHAGNLLHLGRVRLSSDVTSTSLDQDATSSEGLGSRQLLWQERLNLQLPWRLRSDLTYRYHDNESAFHDGAGADRTLSDQGHDVELHLIHRLYESLDTTYTFLGSTHDSSGGESDSYSHGITWNYSKSIPRGTVLAGLSVGTGETGSRGDWTDIVNEPHVAISVPTDAFLLSQVNVDEASIAVFLRSPLPPFEAILLARDVNYVVRPVPHRNTYEIQVLTLPARFAVPGSYDFLVSYTLVGGRFGIRSDSVGANVSVELLDNLLTPYLSYVAVTSEVVSGSFPGDPVDSTITTAGIRVRYEPVSVTGEYQQVDAIVSPYDQWKIDVQVVASLGRSTSVYGSALYTDRQYTEGGYAGLPGEYTEKRESVSGTLRQQLFSRSLTLSIGGSYARVRGLQDSLSHTADASLSWRVGKVDLSAGASTYASDTETPDFPDTRRDHTSFYLRLRRQFF